MARRWRKQEKTSFRCSCGTRLQADIICNLPLGGVYQQLIKKTSGHRTKSTVKPPLTHQSSQARLLFSPDGLAQIPKWKGWGKIRTCPENHHQLVNSVIPLVERKKKKFQAEEARLACQLQLLTRPQLALICPVNSPLLISFFPPKTLPSLISETSSSRLPSSHPQVSSTRLKMPATAEETRRYM